MPERFESFEDQEYGKSRARNQEQVVTMQWAEAEDVLRSGPEVHSGKDP